MFPRRFFPAWFFPPTYFPVGGATPITPVTPLSPIYNKVTGDYLVRVYDTDGNLQAIFDHWIALSIEHRLNRFSTHQFSIDLPDSRVSYFAKDAFVEVLRRVPGLDIGWYQEYIGFHRTPQWQITSSGKRIFTSYGRGLLDLINRRNILYLSGTAGASKSGPIETVVKEYVDENAGPGATSPPRLFDGVTQGLTVEADAGLGATWTGARMGHRLLDIIGEIAALSSLIFEVVWTGPATFEFRIKEPTDRTTVGLNSSTGLNGAGNIPVIFKPELGNMAVPSLTNSATEEVTAVIVLGQGQESDRAYVQRTSAAISDSPWNRIEDARDARQEASTAGLETLGDESLEEMQARESFTCEIIQTPATAYGRDYFFTDLIEVGFDEIVREKQIVGVNINVAQGQEGISLELGDIS